MEKNILPDRIIPRSILSLLPPEFVFTYSVLPYRYTADDRLEVFMAEPFSTDVLQMLQVYLGGPVKPVGMAPQELRQLMMNYYPAGPGGRPLIGGAPLFAGPVAHN